MKLLLLLLALQAHAQGVQPVPQDAVFPLPLFTEGLNTRYSANVIPDGALSEALNVLLDQDVNGVVVSRNGYAKYNASALPNAQSVRGLWEFDATDGTKYLVAMTSASFYQSNGGGSFTLIPGLSAFSQTQDFDCVQTIGLFLCANGLTSFSWDGASTATLTNAPNGNLVGAFRNRLLMAGVAGQQGRVLGSGELNANDWTVQVPGVSTTPVSLAFDGSNDGENVTCLMGQYQDVYLVGKQRKLYGVYGFGRNDFAIRQISSEVGCTDQHSVREKNNCKYWLSLRGVEKFCGASIERISDPIRNNIDNIIAAAGNLRNVVDTSQSDFQAGTLCASGNGACMSATISPGNVVPSSWSSVGSFNSYSWVQNDLDTTAVPSASFDNFSSGNLNKWSVQSGSWGTNSGVVSNSTTMFTSSAGGEINISNSFSSGTWSFVFLSTASTSNNVDFYLYCNKSRFTNSGAGCTDNIAGGTDQAIYLQIPLASNNGFTCFVIHQTLSGGSPISCGSTGVNLNDGNPHTFLVTLSSTNFFTASVDGSLKVSSQIVSGFNISNSNSKTGFYEPNSNLFNIGNVYIPQFYENQVSTAYNTGLSTPIFSPVSVSISSSSLAQVNFNAQVATSASGAWSSYVLAYPNPPSFATSNQFIRYQLNYTPAQTTPIQSSLLNTVQLSAETTGYFISQCRQPASSISTWGLFQCNTHDNGGSFIFSIATGTSCGQVTSPTTNWQTQTNNSIITAGTSTYVAYRALFSMASGTNTPTLQDCTINWNEGGARPPMASAVYLDRYYMAFSSATASGAVNDHIFVLDKNDKWTLFDDHNCYSLAFYQRKLYCGSSTSAGQVWLMDVGTNDDGNIINSKIKTKAFNLGIPERRKIFHRLYLDLEPSPDPTQSILLNAGFTVERGSTTISLNTVDINEDPGYLLTSKFWFPMSNSTSGRYIQLTLSSNSLNSPWRLFSGRLYYVPIDPE